MKPVLVALTLSIAVIGIVGISYFADFDANQVPTGLLDTIPMKKTVSDSFDNQLIIIDHKGIQRS